VTTLFKAQTAKRKAKPADVLFFRRGRAEVAASPAWITMDGDDDDEDDCGGPRGRHSRRPGHHRPVRVPGIADDGIAYRTALRDGSDYNYLLFGNMSGARDGDAVGQLDPSIQPSCARRP
jgi:hypothetical protein